MLNNFKEVFKSQKLGDSTNDESITHIFLFLFMEYNCFTNQIDH